MFLLMLAEAAAPAAEVSPQWEQMPTAEEVARAYPYLAARKQAGGRAVLACSVTAEGALTRCAAEEEEPEGLGFAAGALRLARFFRMTAVTADGQSVEGGQVRVPIRFVAPQGQPRGPDFAPAQACYGQTAALAESNPYASGAWKAAIYWRIQLDVALAQGGGHPSEAEALARTAREAAGAGGPPSGSALETCLAKAAGG